VIRWKKGGGNHGEEKVSYFREFHYLDQFTIRLFNIEVKNKTGFELSHLTFYLSYPIITANGTEGNPFVIQGEPDNLVRPVSLEFGDTIQYSIFAPVNKVFSSSDLLDFNNPTVELYGYVKEGKQEIPFGIVGGLEKGAIIDGLE